MANAAPVGRGSTRLLAIACGRIRPGDCLPALHPRFNRGYPVFRRSTAIVPLARCALVPVVAFASLDAPASTPVTCPAHDIVPFCDIEDVTPPTGVSQLIYMPEHGLLVIRNAQSAVATIDLSTHATSLHFANVHFFDMAVSPSRRYLYAADYGNEIFSGNPQWTSFVHRLDLQTGLWETKLAHAAFRVQVVADDRFVLEDNAGWSGFTDNLWTSGAAVIPVNTPTDAFWGPEYRAFVYEGNFRFAARSGRLLHGNSGLSSNEIQAFTFSGNEFVKADGTGGYGSAQGFGGTQVLATDESGFYYGQLEVDPLDVTHTLRVFPQAIVAASADIAFAADGYYDAHTGQPVGSLGLSSTQYGLNPGGADFWVFDASQNLLRHFAPDDGIFTDALGG